MTFGVLLIRPLAYGFFVMNKTLSYLVGFAKLLAPFVAVVGLTVLVLHYGLPEPLVYIIGFALIAPVCAFFYNKTTNKNKTNKLDGD